jgi:hypothetical protein
MKNENERCLAIQCNEIREERRQQKVQKIFDLHFSRPTLAPPAKEVQKVLVFSILDTWRLILCPSW